MTQMLPISFAMGMRVNFVGQGLVMRSGGCYLFFGLDAWGYAGAVDWVAPATALEEHFSARRVWPRLIERYRFYQPDGARIVNPVEDHITGRVEHHVELKSPPTGPKQGALQLIWAFESDVELELEVGSQSAMVSRGSKAVFIYRKPLVLDQKGAAFELSLTAEGTRLIFNIDDEGAQYPLHFHHPIEPLKPGSAGGSALIDVS